MLKWFLALMWVPSLIFGAAPGSGIVWHDDFAQAKQIATEQKKPMFLFFTGSDWCGWCKKLEREVLDTPQFAQEVGSLFVFVKLDFPLRGFPTPAIEKQNEALKNQYGINGFPTVVILNRTMGQMGTIGYQQGGPGPYAAAVKNLAGKN